MITGPQTGPALIGGWRDPSEGISRAANNVLAGLMNLQRMRYDAKRDRANRGPDAVVTVDVGPLFAASQQRDKMRQEEQLLDAIVSGKDPAEALAAVDRQPSTWDGVLDFLGMNPRYTGPLETASRVKRGMVEAKLAGQKPPSIAEQQWNLLTPEQQALAAQYHHGLAGRPRTPRPYEDELAAERLGELRDRRQYNQKEKWPRELAKLDQEIKAGEQTYAKTENAMREQALRIERLEQQNASAKTMAAAREKLAGLQATAAELMNKINTFRLTRERLATEAAEAMSPEQRAEAAQIEAGLKPRAGRSADPAKAQAQAEKVLRQRLKGYQNDLADLWEYDANGNPTAIPARNAAKAERIRSMIDNTRQELDKLMGVENPLSDAQTLDLYERRDTSWRNKFSLGVIGGQEQWVEKATGQPVSEQTAAELDRMAGKSVGPTKTAGKTLTADIAKSYLQRAGRDRTKAMEMATRDGYTWEE